MTASVLTLTRRRRPHLINLMESLGRQTVQPSELIIACMQDSIEDGLPELAFPVHQFLVPGDPLPLARARNMAAARAKSDTFVFLDVDCIASPTLVEAFLDACNSQDGLFLGEVLYLPGPAVRSPFDFHELDRTGIVHPSKPPCPETGLQRESNTGEFWGLSFAIRKPTWDRIGGMDETFIGYGAEETDLAARLDPAGIPLFWVGGARSYHQHHAVHVPPLQHFDSIVTNAQRFYAKHSRWCMDYWLGQFAEKGFISWDLARADLQILRKPTIGEIADTRQPDTVRFS